MRRIIIFFFVVLILIALSGTLYQKYYTSSRCAYDGCMIQPIYEVKIFLKDGSVKKFCTVFCAANWFKPNADNVEKVILKDEIRGTEISSEIAYLVESELVTNKSNGNRIHVFQRRIDAIEHMKRFNGDYEENPFYKE